MTIKWYSIEEKLPKQEDKVIVLKNNGNVYDAVYEWDYYFECMYFSHENAEGEEYEMPLEQIKCWCYWDEILKTLPKGN